MTRGFGPNRKKRLTVEKNLPFAARLLLNSRPVSRTAKVQPAETSG
jgi:hypothetical protein